MTLTAWFLLVLTCRLDSCEYVPLHIPPYETEAACTDTAIAIVLADLKLGKRRLHGFQCVERSLDQ